MSQTPTSTPPGDRNFRTTRWSVVVVAGGASDQAREALDSLVRSYWYPLYAYLRRKGIDSARAQDLTQGFFTRLLERRDLQSVAPEKGRFRAYLLAGLKHFLQNEAEKERAEKRGGKVHTFSIDADEARGRWDAEPEDQLTPERQFERAWARSVLDRCFELLEEESVRKGQGRLYELLLGHLTGSLDPPSYREIAEQLESTEGAVKVAAHRLRRRYGELLRQEIAHTVAEPSEVEAEVRHLMNCL